MATDIGPPSGAQLAVMGALVFSDVIDKTTKPPALRAVVDNVLLSLNALPVDIRMEAMGMKVLGWFVPDHGWFEYDDHPDSVGYCVKAPKGGITHYVAAL